ncbi:hypothetical protein RQP46_007824 [Phenoliferia psychrophenolica]
MSYTLLGKKVLKRVSVSLLISPRTPRANALGVYSLVGLGVFAAMRGDSKAPAKVPEIVASSDDETKFLQDFIANLEKEDAASAKAHA